MISKPPVVVDGEVLPIDQRPLRLSNGFRLGGDTSLKMMDDHWWSTFRVNVGVFQYATDAVNKIEVEFDKQAAETLGTLFGVQGVMGLRYYFLTDRVRPYFQGGLSFLRLFSFTSQSSTSCDSSIYSDVGLCGTGDAGSTNAENYLPHPNVGGIFLQPGVEFIMTRDIALNVFTLYERWILLNAADNNSLAFGLGVIFYT